MSRKEKFEEQYKRTFDKVHAPEDLLGKVKNMNEQSKIKTFTQRNIKVAVAALAVIFLSTNAITYASSGSTWVGKVVLKINGQEKEMDAVYSKSNDGEKQEESFVVEIPGEEEGNIVFEIEEEGPSDGESETEVEVYGEATASDFDTNLIKENDRIFLTVNDIRLDITEDYADGSCSGTFELNETTYGYEVTGTIDEYNISIAN